MKRIALIFLALTLAGCGMGQDIPGSTDNASLPKQQRPVDDIEVDDPPIVLPPPVVICSGMPHCPT